MLVVTDQNFFLLLFIIVLAVESTDYVTQWLHVTLDMLSKLSMACFTHLLTMGIIIKPDM